VVFGYSDYSQDNYGNQYSSYPQSYQQDEYQDNNGHQYSSYPQSHNKPNVNCKEHKMFLKLVSLFSKPNLDNFTPVGSTQIEVFNSPVFDEYSGQQVGNETGFSIYQSCCDQDALFSTGSIVSCGPNSQFSFTGIQQNNAAGSVFHYVVTGGTGDKFGAKGEIIGSIDQNHDYHYDVYLVVEDCS